MSRRRYISTEISVDKRIRRLSDSAALFYTWMIPHAEEDATITSDAEELAALVVPNRNGWTARKVALALEEIASEELVVVLNGTIYFPPESFYRYQSNVHAERRRSEQPLQNTNNSAKQRETARNSASPSPSPSPSKHMSNKLDEFDAFWKLYPRKEGKGAAQAAFLKASQKVGVHTIVAGLDRQLPALRLKEKQFVPHPATWLNQDRWDDEVQLPSTPQAVAYQRFKPPTDDEIADLEAKADFGRK